MDQANAEKTINFPIVFHFHQPVGNFGWTIEEAYKLSYLPLIQTIEKFPKLKVGLHFSGFLLEFLATQHPEYMDLLRSLAKKKQIEIVGGAFYEPIIAMIPDEDKLEQIELLRSYIKKQFGLETQGFWLAERVWEPTLPRVLNQAKVKYIFIDDYHLRMNGLTEEETFYTYITEEQGAKVTVVSINEPLRYLTPWKSVDETYQYLKRNASTEPDRLICLIDDAEKFGVWGTTHELCYGKGFDGKPWLEWLFTMVEQNSWIHNLTLSEYFEKYEPRGLVYMPTASYDKMSYWVLPTPERITLERLLELAKNKKIEYADDLIKFLRGGFWRQFLVKYYESNNLHKKMLYVREKFSQVEKQWGRRTEEIQSALQEIFKSQCNDVYWHGQFGGIYFGFMRANQYHYLIQAEKMLEGLYWNKKKLTPKVSLYDIDKDGRDEVLMETSLINLYFHPFRGGSVFEIDLKGKGFNIQNTFQRRKEAYYKDTLEFNVDRWRRYAFYDHFVPDQLMIEELIKDNYKELGNFLQIHYKSEISHKENGAKVNLWAKGNVSAESRLYPLKISKVFEIREGKNEIEITYTVENLGNAPVHVNHLMEIPLYLSGDTKSSSFRSDQGESEFLKPETFFTKTLEVYAQENGLRVTLNLLEPVKVFKYILETYARTNGGYDSLYQGTVLSLMRPLDLKPTEPASWKINIILN
jgi:hypothetical protein